MSWMGDVAVQVEFEKLLELIESLKSSGKTDTEILDHIQRDIKEIIEDCKTGWR